MNKLIGAFMPVIINRTPVPKKEDNWTCYWYREQKMEALEQVVSMRNLVAKNSVFRKVSQPVLMLYYYRDKENQDTTASASQMRKAFAEFGKMVKRDPRSRAVPVVNGQHVLLSKYVKSDWGRAEKQITSFISEIV
jgi:hypothetical protein